MAGIEEHNNNMTIYYSKSNGSIKACVRGVQNMNFYGQNKDDFSIIWDFVVLPFDEQVVNNMNKFSININTLELELLPEYAFDPNKYSIKKESD